MEYQPVAPRIILAGLIGLIFALFFTSRTSAASLVSYDTRHYRLYTDVDPDFAHDLAIRLDAMYDEYSRRLSAFGNGSVDRLDVYVFNKRDDYSEFIQDRLPNTGGVFIPSRNVLCAYLEDQGRDALRRTLQHEAFHQFAHWTISPNVPVWINEGIAQIFEEGIWTGRSFIVEQLPPRRLRQLQSDIANSRLADFETFINTDHRSWAKIMHDRERGAVQYNQAWAMVYFLVFAVDSNDRPLYRERFFKMLRIIHDGGDPQIAFESCFGTNYKGFERRFKEYAKQLSVSRESRYVEQLEVLSDLLVEINSDENYSFRDIRAFRQHLIEGGYRLTYTRGNLKWQSDPDITTYFRDLDGRDLTGTNLNFVTSNRNVLPDIVLQPAGALEYRSRFYFDVDGKLGREILIQSN